MNGDVEAPYDGQTRLKLVIGGCLLFAVEAAVSGMWSKWPFLELAGLQSGLILAYIGAKSYTTRSMAKYNCANAGEAEGK